MFCLEGLVFLCLWCSLGVRRCGGQVSGVCSAQSRAALVLSCPEVSHVTALGDSAALCFLLILVSAAAVNQRDAHLPSSPGECFEDLLDYHLETWYRGYL